MKLNKFDQKQLEALRGGEYENASLHIILLDLCLDVGVDGVFMMLHNVASDMRKRKNLEDMFKGARKWKWDKYR